jgi:hypothetical protein
MLLSAGPLAGLMLCVPVPQWLTDIFATRGQNNLADGYDESENQSSFS